MTIEELMRHLAIYSSDWNRWPGELKEDAQLLLKASPEARSLYEAERRLDDALDLVQPTPAGAVQIASLVKRATALPQGPSHTPVTTPRRWYHTSLARAATLAGLFLVGLAIGANEPISPALSQSDPDVGALFRELLFAEEWIP
jgi:hypothetical protein